jgi:ribosome recycling factor
MPSYDKGDLQRRMHGAVEVLKHDFGGLRTGRASTALLDPVHVEVYGANMPLNQVATVSVPEPRLLSVQVWDRGNIGAVEKVTCGARDRIEGGASLLCASRTSVRDGYGNGRRPVMTA